MDPVAEMMAGGKKSVDADDEPMSGEYDLTADEELAGHQAMAAQRAGDAKEFAKAICALIDLHTSKLDSEESSDLMRQGEEET